VPDFVNAAWSAAQNRPLRQQMLPLSATGGGRICCPSEGAYICAKFSICYKPKAIINTLSFSAGASPPPYTDGVNLKLSEKVKKIAP